MKFEGSLSGIRILVMVDSGATHNFVSQKLIVALGLPSTQFSGISIQLGDGHKTFVDHKCSALDITIGQYLFSVDALVFEMDHLDLVLGMEWLKTLGEVVHNWQTHSMRFHFGNQDVFLQGMSYSQSATSLQCWLSPVEFLPEFRAATYDPECRLE